MNKISLIKKKPKTLILTSVNEKSSEKLLLKLALNCKNTLHLTSIRIIIDYNISMYNQRYYAMYYCTSQ